MRVIRTIVERWKGVRYLGLLFLIFGQTTLTVAEPVPDGSGRHREALQHVRSEIARGEATTEEILRQLRSLAGEVGGGGTAQELYYRGEIEYLYGALAEVDGESRQAESHYAEAADLAEAAVREDRENASARRLLADSLMRLAGHRGKLYGMRVIGRVREQLESAFRMRPADPAIQVSLAKFYATAPGALGGDIEAARALCEAVLNQAPEVYRFRAYLVLSTVREEEGNRRAALSAALRAAEIYPRNDAARRRVDELR